MNAYRYRVSLRIAHASADLTYLDDALGMRARWGWRAGEPHAQAQAGIREYSYWCTAFNDDEAMSTGDEPLESFLEKTLQHLAERADVFTRLAETGGEVELFIGLFLEGNSGVSLAPTLGAQAAALSMMLQFDIYPPDDPNDMLLL